VWIKLSRRLIGICYSRRRRAAWRKMMEAASSPVPLLVGEVVLLGLWLWVVVGPVEVVMKVLVRVEIVAPVMTGFPVQGEEEKSY
jgi:hypothetical protein